MLSKHIYSYRFAWMETLSSFYRPYNPWQRRWIKVWSWSRKIFVFATRLSSKRVNCSIWTQTMCFSSFDEWSQDLAFLWWPWRGLACPFLCFLTLFIRDGFTGLRKSYWCLLTFVRRFSLEFLHLILWPSLKYNTNL